MSIKKTLNSNFFCYIFFFIFFNMLSCVTINYNKKDFKSYKSDIKYGNKVLVLHRNNFQFSLLDYSVFDGETYPSLNNKLYSVKNTNLDTKKNLNFKIEDLLLKKNYYLSITDGINEGFILKDSNNMKKFVLKKDIENDLFYIESDGTILKDNNAGKLNIKNIELNRDVSQLNFIKKDDKFVLKKVFDSKNKISYVLFNKNSENDTQNKEVQKVYFRKELDYFTDFLDFDNNFFDETLLISVAIFIDCKIKKQYGDYKN